MPQVIAYELPRDLFFQGQWRAMRARIGLTAPIACFLCFLLFVRSLVFGAPEWLMALFGAVAAGGLLVAVFLMQSLYAKIEAFDRRTSPLRVTLTLADDGLEARSDMGTVAVRWDAFRRRIETPQYWLLLQRDGGVLTIPAEALSEADMAFLRARVAR